MTSNRNQFHFTETIYLCLRSLRGDCIVTADFWANSPKGGDAKPPVYGTQVPMTAGLPGRTLTHSDRAGHARFAESVASTDSSRATPGSRLPPAMALGPHAGHLDKARSHSLCFGNASCAARDAFTTPATPRRPLQTSTNFREATHVLFDSALIYSAPDFKTGRSFSGVMS
jgi:hypothetical protein